MVASLFSEGLLGTLDPAGVGTEFAVVKCGSAKNKKYKFNFYFYFTYILLTKHGGRTRRISARGLDRTVPSKLG